MDNLALTFLDLLHCLSIIYKNSKVLLLLFSGLTRNYCILLGTVVSLYYNLWYLLENDLEF